MNDIKQVTFFMEECRRMGLHVLGPDVNESFYKFTVNDEYAVRFGMGAIKGVGAGAVNTIVENRQESTYRSIFDLAKRIDLRAANKKAFENLALAGGFDCFVDTHRAQYFHTDGDVNTFLEKAIKYGAKYQENENSAQVSLFGESSEVQIPEPVLPDCEPWSTMETLAKEKEVVGIYISGHPLDDFKFEMKYFCNVKVEDLIDLKAYEGRSLTFGGMISNVQFRTSAKGKDWAMFAVEGYDESFEFRMFNEEFLKFRHFLLNNTFVYFKILVKEGWIRKDTGEKSEPRIQFQEMKLLEDVIPLYAKKLIIQMNIKELKENQIEQIRMLFDTHQGSKAVTFEILEIEKVQKQLEDRAITRLMESDTEIDDDNLDVEIDESVLMVPQEKDEFRVVTKLELPSKNSAIEITAELLEELEKLQVNFRLN